MQRGVDLGPRGPPAAVHRAEAGPPLGHLRLRAGRPDHTPRHHTRHRHHDPHLRLATGRGGLQAGVRPPGPLAQLRRRVGPHRASAHAHHRVLCRPGCVSGHVLPHGGPALRARRGGIGRGKSRSKHEGGSADLPASRLIGISLHLSLLILTSLAFGCLQLTLAGLVLPVLELDTKRLACQQHGVNRLLVACHPAPAAPSKPLGFVLPPVFGQRVIHSDDLLPFFRTHGFERCMGTSTLGTQCSFTIHPMISEFP